VISPSSPNLATNPCRSARPLAPRTPYRHIGTSPPLPSTLAPSQHLPASPSPHPAISPSRHLPIFPYPHLPIFPGRLLASRTTHDPHAYHQALRPARRDSDPGATPHRRQRLRGLTPALARTRARARARARTLTPTARPATRSSTRTSLTPHPSPSASPSPSPQPGLLPEAQRVPHTLRARAALHDGRVQTLDAHAG